VLLVGADDFGAINRARTAGVEDVLFYETDDHADLIESIEDDTDAEARPRDNFRRPGPTRRRRVHA
jgi:hypothetical protein